MNISSQKQLLRQQIKKKRQQISIQEQFLSSQILVTSFWSVFSNTPPCIIAGYWPTPYELNILPLLLSLYEQGWTCTLPTVVQPQQPLQFRLWTPSTTLHKDAANIPAPNTQQPQLTPSILLIPLLAFDKQKRRLGQGGGYYDRTLSTLKKENNPLTIGIAFSQQMVHHIPQEPHDQKLNTIITQNFILK